MRVIKYLVYSVIFSGVLLSFTPTTLAQNGYAGQPFTAAAPAEKPAYVGPTVLAVIIASAAAFYFLEKYNR